MQTLRLFLFTFHLFDHINVHFYRITKNLEVIILHKSHCTISRICKHKTMKGEGKVLARTESHFNMGIDVASYFENILRTEQTLATAIAAQRTLTMVLEKCSARTLQELVKLLQEASNEMKSVDCSVSSVVSGCELFLRFITLASKLEEGTFEEIRAVMLTKGMHFLEKMMSARNKIAKLGANNISDGSVSLIFNCLHGFQNSFPLL